MSKTNANRLIDAAEVATNVTPIGDVVVEVKSVLSRFLGLGKTEERKEVLNRRPQRSQRNLTMEIFPVGLSINSHASTRAFVYRFSFEKSRAVSE
jgi:hypothetical protein